MRYRVHHVTTYTYSDPVSLSHNLLHLAPRDTANQQVLDSHLRIDPSPTNLKRYADYFGNQQVLFVVQKQHAELRIAATHLVNCELPVAPEVNPLWETVRERLHAPTNEFDRQAAEFAYASGYAPTSPELSAYAAAHFAPATPLLDGCDALTAHIYESCTYDPKSTTISTPVSEVLQIQRGVCQDFAHLAIAALRSIGLAARYVSGYIETRPPPGRKKLRGADASHAWFQVYLPDFGWVDFDPTNNCRLGPAHVTCAYGRDFADVTPTRGLILGGGKAKIEVAVDVDVVH